MRPTRDDVGLLHAFGWALRGTCARRQVGCVLADADGYTLSAGFNGPAAGEPHCTEVACLGAGLPSGEGLDRCEACYAERNALTRCPDARRVHTCYVTSAPCIHCVKDLLNTGCRRIVYAEAYPHETEARVRWVRAGRDWIFVPEPRFAIVEVER